MKSHVFLFGDNSILLHVQTVTLIERVNPHLEPKQFPNLDERRKLRMRPPTLDRDPRGQRLAEECRGLPFGQILFLTIPAYEFSYLHAENIAPLWITFNAAPLIFTARQHKCCTMYTIKLLLILMKDKSLLWKVRRLKGWTLDDVIARVQRPAICCRSALAKIEKSGRVKPATGLKLARLFKIPPTVLFPLVFPTVQIPNVDGHGLDSSGLRVKSKSRKRSRHE
mgnify:CR=1 FL=1